MVVERHFLSGPKVKGEAKFHLASLETSAALGLRRVLDAVTEEADERLADSLPRFVDVVHGQLALVELSVLDLAPYRVGDGVFDAFGRGLREELDGRVGGPLLVYRRPAG